MVEEFEKTLQSYIRKNKKIHDGYALFFLLGERNA